MNRYQIILDDYKQTLQRLEELELEYSDQKKGEVYRKRKIQIIDKLDGLKKKVKSIGTTGNICHVYGKRSRPHAKNPKIMVQERFNLYFTNVSEEEVSGLVKAHVANIDSYTIKFIRPGMLLITS